MTHVNQGWASQGSLEVPAQTSVVILDQRIGSSEPPVPQAMGGDHRCPQLSGRAWDEARNCSSIVGGEGEKVKDKAEKEVEGTEQERRKASPSELCQKA